MHVYSSNDPRVKAWSALAILAVVVAMVSGALWSELGSIPSWLFGAPTVAGAYGLLFAGLDRFAWRWEWLNKIGLVEVPKVEGAYEGELISSFEVTTLPIRVYIDQTWTRIAIRFEVVEPKSSTSYSVAAALSRGGHSTARLVYTYRNQVQPGIADLDMRDHDGTAELSIDCDSGEASGRYFNFRGRQGTLRLQRSKSRTT